MWAWSGRTKFRAVSSLIAAVVAFACASSEKGGQGGSAGEGSGGDGGSGLAMTGGSASGTAGGGARGGSATSGGGGTAPGGGSSATGGSSGSGGSGGSSGSGGSGGPPTCPEDEPRGPPPSFTPPDCAISDTTLLCEYDTMPDGGVTCRASYRCQCLSDHMGGVDCWWNPDAIACPDAGT